VPDSIQSGSSPSSHSSAKGGALLGNRVLWEAMSEKVEMLAAGEDGLHADRFSHLEEVGGGGVFEETEGRKLRSTRT